MPPLTPEQEAQEYLSAAAFTDDLGNLVIPLETAERILRTAIIEAEQAVLA